MNDGIDVDRALSLPADTPFLALDPNIACGQMEAIRSQFDSIEVCYAVKCNPHESILRALADRGASFDVASTAEVDLVAALGIDFSRVLYSNPIRSAGHCKYAIERGVRRFVCDDLDQISGLAAVCGEDVRSEVSLQARVSVTNAGSLIRLDSKFGLAMARVGDLYHAAGEAGFAIHGICFHVGSQASGPSVWTGALARVAEVARWHPVGELNVGGGFPIEYREHVVSLEDIASTIRSGIDEAGLSECDLMCEPGRYIAGPAGAVVATVISRHEREGQSWVYLDVGRFQAFGELFETERVAPKTYFGSDLRNSSVGPAVLTGPSCDAYDTLFEVVNVPDELGPGDRVCFAPAGAYTTVYGSPFNGFPVPRPVLLS